MITIKDCEGFCDADPSWVHEMACRDCLTMVPAYAAAHHLEFCVRHFERCESPVVDDLRATA